MNVLLTGAGGFVGRQLLARLKENVIFMRAVSRSTHPSLAQADDVVIENLTPQSDFKTLLASIDTVIHLADGFNDYEHARALARNDQASKRLQTTIMLANAAAKQGTDFIYLSTIKTMCGAYADHVLTETSPPAPQSLYGSLKLEAEQAIIKASQKYDTRAVILRFPVIFGPGAGGNMEKLRKLADSALPLPFFGLDNKRSLISSESLIDAVNHIVQHDRAKGGLYLVQDGAISTTDLIKVMRSGLGRPDRQFKIPNRYWPVIEKLPFIGPKALRFTRSLELDDRHFRKSFNWRPPKPFPASLQEWAKTKAHA